MSARRGLLCDTSMTPFLLHRQLLLRIFLLHTIQQTFPNVHDVLTATVSHQETEFHVPTTPSVLHAANGLPNEHKTNFFYRHQPKAV